MEPYEAGVLVRIFEFDFAPCERIRSHNSAHHRRALIGANTACAVAGLSCSVAWGIVPARRGLWSATMWVIRRPISACIRAVTRSVTSVSTVSSGAIGQRPTVPQRALGASAMTRLAALTNAALAA